MIYGTAGGEKEPKKTADDLISAEPQVKIDFEGAARKILARYQDLTAIERGALLWENIRGAGTRAPHHDQLAGQRALEFLIEASGPSGRRATKRQVIAAIEIFYRADKIERRNLTRIYTRMAVAMENAQPKPGS